MPDELYILLVVERENEVYSHECPFNTIFITGMSNTDILGRYCAEDVIGDDCLLHYRKYVKDKTATSGLCILYMQHEENTVFYHVMVKDKAVAQADADVQAAISKVAERLGDTGRILVRESGTEPLIRVMVEAETKEICHTYVDEVVSIINKKEATR